MREYRVSLLSYFTGRWIIFILAHSYPGQLVRDSTILLVLKTLLRLEV